MSARKVCLAGIAAVLVVGASLPAPAAEAAAPPVNAVYVGSSSRASIAVVDPVSGAVSQIAVPAATPSVVLSPDGTRLYARQSFGKVDVIDVVTGTVTAEWNIGAQYAFTSTGLAVSRDGTVLAVAGGNCRVILLDTATGTVLRNLDYTATGACNITGVALAADTRTVYAVDHSGNRLLAFHTVGGAPFLVQDRTTSPATIRNDPAGLLLSPDGSQLFISFDLPNTTGEPSVSRLDTATYSLQGSYVLASQTGAGPRGGTQMSYSIDDDLVYVAMGQYSGVAWAIDADTPADVRGSYQITAAGVLPGGGSALAAGGAAVYFSDASSAGGLVAVDRLTGTQRRYVLPAGAAAGVAAAPDQAPSARLADAEGVPGETVTLDASASTVPVGSIVSYTWDFGDGSPPRTTTAPTIDHTYGVAGRYIVTVTATSSGGTSTTIVYDGTRVTNNGSPSARTTATVDIVAPSPSPSVSQSAGPPPSASPSAAVPSESAARPTPAAGPSLPLTGASLSWLAGLGIASIAGGLVLLFAVRRHRGGRRID